MKFLVSLTTIPRRAEHDLHVVLQSLKDQDIDADIILNVPVVYRKWGPAPQNIVAALPKGVELNFTSEEYGPATKLLGALELSSIGDYDAVITVDDDVVFSNRGYLSYLAGYFKIDPQNAYTVGGIALQSWPYHNKFGLSYGAQLRFVDAVRGVAGTVYPVAPLINTALPFDLRKECPEGVFHDDDAYFGAVLHKLGVRVVAVPSMPNNTIREVDSNNQSGVAEGQARSRAHNESTLFRAFVRNGMIGHGLLRRRLPPSLHRDFLRHFEQSRN